MLMTLQLFVIPSAFYVHDFKAGHMALFIPSYVFALHYQVVFVYISFACSIVQKAMIMI